MARDCRRFSDGFMEARVGIEGVRIRRQLQARRGAQPETTPRTTPYPPLAGRRVPAAHPPAPVGIAPHQRAHAWLPDGSGSHDPRAVACPCAEPAPVLRGLATRISEYLTCLYRNKRPGTAPG